jgi:hypothetical protein
MSSFLAGIYHGQTVRFSADNGSLFRFEQFTFQVWITNVQPGVLGEVEK